jgi:CheY-like chemotaxis protein
MGRLFVEFQQLDASTAKKYPGTGLGLALTKRIVEAQHGRVGVRSVPGSGSVFFAVLPRDGGSVEHDAVDSVPADGTAPLILVIEDDANDRAWLAETLRLAGYAVELAATGGDALLKCAHKAFDAITLDLILPDQSGWDLLLAIRGTELNRETPVVVATMVAESGAATGFPISDILPKPVDAGALLAALERAGVERRKNRSVLVIDDDQKNLRLAASLLEQAGYRPICFASAEDALAASQREPPAAIVLDLMMPGMDGYEFLACFRRTFHGQTVPIIVWSAACPTESQRALLRGPLTALVGKHDINLLLDQVERSLAPRRRGASE